MSNRQRLSIEQSHSVGTQLGCDWTQVGIELFHRELQSELESSSPDRMVSVPNDYLALLGKCVWVRLLVWDHMKKIDAHYNQLDQLGYKGRNSIHEDYPTSQSIIQRSNE